MMLPKKLSKNLIFILVGILGSMYLIYIRLILERLPKELICTATNFPFYFFSFSLLIFLLLVKIYIYRFPTKISENTAPTNSWMHKYKEKLQIDSYSEYWRTQLTQLHIFLIDTIPYNGNFLEFLLKLGIKNYLILRIFYFGLTFGPRYLLGLIFFF